MGKTGTVSARRTFWEHTRYDRRFWAIAYAVLAVLAALLLLLAYDGASQIVRLLCWLIVAPLVFNVLYTLWKWRREGRWIRPPRPVEPGR